MSDSSFDDETVEFSSFASDEERPATMTPTTEVNDAKNLSGARETKLRRLFPFFEIRSERFLFCFKRSQLKSSSLKAIRFDFVARLSRFVCVLAVALGVPLTTVLLQKRCHLSLARLFWLFLTFGLRAWGGPVVQIDMQRSYFVDEVRWISKVRFNRVLAVYQALPGFVLRGALV